MDHSPKWTTLKDQCTPPSEDDDGAIGAIRALSATFQGEGGHFRGRLARLATKQGLLDVPAKDEDRVIGAIGALEQQPGHTISVEGAYVCTEKRMTLPHNVLVVVTASWYLVLDPTLVSHTSCVAYQVDFVDFDLINRIVGVSPYRPQARIRTGRAHTTSSGLCPL